MARERAPGHELTKLANRLRRRIFALAGQGEVSGAQGRALHFLLAQGEPVFQRDLEEEFGLRAPTASGLLKQMEQNGLIRREADPDDARRKRIIVSESAAACREQVIREMNELEQTLTRGIPPEELEIFLRVIDRMTDNLA